MDIEGTYLCSRCLLPLDDEKVCRYCGYDGSTVSALPSELEESTFLNDRYLLGAVISSDSLCVKYAAWDEALRAPIAIREYYPREYVRRDINVSDEVIPLEGRRDEFRAGLSRFIREAGESDSPQSDEGIAKTCDCFEENGTAYVVTKYERDITMTSMPRAGACVSAAAES